MSVAENQRGELAIAHVTQALSSGGASQGKATPPFSSGGGFDAYSINCANTGGGGSKIGEVAFTLDRGASKNQAIAFNHIQTPVSGPASPCISHTGMGVAHAARVRRLTPVECERLQGFDDDWTRVPIARVSRNRLKALRAWEYREIDGEVWKLAADGPRYRAIGNSMAVPVMAWIGCRLAFLHRLLFAQHFDAEVCAS